MTKSVHYKESLDECSISGVNAVEMRVLYQIFEHKQWIKKDTKEVVEVYPMSSWGYGTYGPGSVTVKYIDDSERETRLFGIQGSCQNNRCGIFSFKPKQFLELFEPFYDKTSSL